MVGKVLFVPLDDRPCCLQFTERLAEMAGVKLIPPPRHLLGGLFHPGEAETLLDWLEGAVTSGAGAALLSLDMLCWGGLVASRNPALSGASAERRLERLGRILEPASIPVLAFQSILRTAPTQTTPEEVGLAKKLLKASFWGAQARLGSSEAERRFRAIALPPGVLERYLEKRECNFRLNRAALDLPLRALLYGIDDSRTAGWNLLEVERLQAEIDRRGSRAWIAPGTDEMALLLLTRLLAPSTPVEIRWSPPWAGRTVTRYEDRPLAEVLRAQAAAAAIELVEAGENQLWVYGPYHRQQESASQAGGGSPRARRFVRSVCQSVNAGDRVAIADVAYANGASSALVRELLECAETQLLAGFAAWNTAGNTLGTALASLALARLDRPRRLFLAERFADDYLYQTSVRNQLKARFPQGGLRLAEHELDSANSLLKDAMAPGLVPILSRFGVGLDQVRLPWPRLFEVEVRAG
ncbi:MAG: DUF4127 family protein [Armatimonadetes bacterium]|nr:DUF4127 family protein [Armatimonadota bacterium]